MNNYSCLLYKRGFLFTDIKNPVFADSESQVILDGWSCLNMGEYKLFHDPILSIGTSGENGNWTIILGLVLNPFDCCTQPDEIAARLMECQSKSEMKFLEYLNQLSGRFLLVSKTGENIEVYHDACGTRTVFYDRFDNHTLVSSHASMIANLMDYEISPETNYFFYHKNYKDAVMKKLPGIMSPYEAVHILTPNTRLRLPERRIERYFPYKENSGYGSYEQLEKVVSELMTSQLNLLNTKTKIALSLTAGIDSRLSLAASKDISDQIEYFTYLTKNKIHVEDVKTAQAICDHFHLSHRIFQWEKNGLDGFKDFQKIWLKNMGIDRGIAWLNKIYADTFPKDRIHVRSNIAEIVKADSDSYKYNDLSDRQLAYLYTTTPMNRDDKVIRKFAEFIKTTGFCEENLFNYDYRDLFEWEFKTCQWHSWLLLESDMSHDTFLIYNNRKILSMMLSLPYKDRLDRKIFIGIIKQLWPGLLNYPVNGKVL